MARAPRARFARYVGIDYSGAATPTSGLPGLRVHCADRASRPVEVRPEPGACRHWTRRGVAEWLVAQLSTGAPALVGIDHGFSFPQPYFDRHRLPRSWTAFLEDFQRHWPTDEDDTYVEFVRDGVCGDGAARMGDPRWRRLTEVRAGGAKSVFLFDVQGSVAKSTHAGLPWLRQVRRRLGRRVHFWPFDGWTPGAGIPVVAEVYPTLWRHGFPRGTRTPDQHDAWVVAESLRRADRDGSLPGWLSPSLTRAERAVARTEGWILGVG